MDRLVEYVGRVMTILQWATDVSDEALPKKSCDDLTLMASMRTREIARAVVMDLILPRSEQMRRSVIVSDLEQQITELFYRIEYREFRKGKGSPPDQ